MARPKKIPAMEDQFYDVFSDWTVEDQAQALKVLNALHRQAQKANAPAPQSKPDEADDKFARG